MGKQVDWHGWVSQVTPARPTLEQIGRLDTYPDGHFRISVNMQNPNDEVGEAANPAVLLIGVTRQQAEQFACWYDPINKADPHQKVMFIGTIVLTDHFASSFHIEVSEAKLEN